jgi:membrane peptidoglycan carboxypeptidase
VAADPTRPATWKTLGKLLASLVAVGVLAAGVLMPTVGGLGLIVGNAAGKFLNTTCTMKESKPPEPTTIYARDGSTVIARLFKQDRVPVPLSQIPKYLQQALIATEDRRFYSHHGVDLRGLIRSAISTGSGDTQGGSTLTMQYVKQVKYYQAVQSNDAKAEAAAVDVNLQRKMEDAKCALYIEGKLHHSKQRILDDYLNIAFFGEHSYGIQVAAETYFNKPASKLTVPESALLVGLLRAPSAYDPFVNRAAAKQRRDEVLQNLVSDHKLSQSVADKEKATPIALATKRPPLVRQGCANANSTVPNAAFFCNYVVNWLETTNGIKESQLETGGLQIVTTLDPNVQKNAQRNMNDEVPASSPMTAVLPVVDPHTGDILAMATSKAYGTGKGQTEQPVFTKYTAPGASTFKLFPLLAALSTGVPSDWQLTTVGNTGTYRATSCPPDNRAGNGDANVFYNDTEDLASATAKSSNTYYLALADQLLNCDLQPIVNIMNKLGMKGLQQHDPNDNPRLTYAQNVVENDRGQELVLGSIPTSPLELAGAYAAVANGGKYNTPAPILSIKDVDGRTIAVKRSPGVQVIAPQVAAQAVQILTGDTQSDGTSASVFSSWYASDPSIIAGKTGTNGSTKKDKNSSIWFVGMTPDLVGATSIIDFDNTSLPSEGLKGQGRGTAYGDFAAKVWLDALRPTLANTSWTWPDPSSVGGEDVPSVVGMSVSDARHTLSDSGFKMTLLDPQDHLLCPSSVPLEQVAYYGPQRADSGATITVCPSSGVAQTVVVPVTTPPPTKHHHHHHQGGTGGGGGTGGSGGGTGGHPGGHRRPTPRPGPGPGQ